MTEEAATPTIDVNYIKSTTYREVSCDGLLGGPTPSNKVWLCFYSERLPVPRVVRHTLKTVEGTGHLTIDPDVPAVPMETRTGLVRNLEVGLYLNIDTAIQLRDWLDGFLRNNQGEPDERS